MILTHPVKKLFRVDPLKEDVGLNVSHQNGMAYDIKPPSKEAVDALNASRHSK